MDDLSALLMNWLDRHHVDLVSVVMTVVLVIGASLVILVLRRLVRTWLERVLPRLHMPYDIALTVTRVLTFVLWTIVLMLALDFWGVALGGVWTLLVSAATAIGVGFLATWAMISNVTASLFITIWRPFRLGDTVEIVPENLKGRVIDSNMMFVAVREDSGAIIRIPNNLFFQKMFRVVEGGTQSLFEAIRPEDAMVRERQPT